MDVLQLQHSSHGAAHAGLGGAEGEAEGRRWEDGRQQLFCFQAINIAY